MRPRGPLRRAQGGPTWHIIMLYTHGKCFRVIWAIWRHAVPFWAILVILSHSGPFWYCFGPFWGPRGYRNGPRVVQYDIYSCNIPMGSVLRSVGAFKGNIWSVAPFIPGAKLYWDGWKYKNALFSKSPNGPVLKFFLVTGEVMVLSELLLDLPVLFFFVGVASGP